MSLENTVGRVLAILVLGFLVFALLNPPPAVRSRDDRHLDGRGERLP